jgi:peroxiredoxin
MTISKGDRLPDVTLVKATPDGPQKVQTSDYFKGKKVALFSVPGAFTPTCSAKHLPGFVEKASELKAKGIDEIVGTAVNDAFVMQAWNKANGSDDITMLADGNGDFAEALGLTMDGSGFGLGKRAQRYSMIVDDGVVKELNVEAPGDFNVSSAEHMLGQLCADLGREKGALVLWASAPFFRARTDQSPCGGWIGTIVSSPAMSSVTSTMPRPRWLVRRL